MGDLTEQSESTTVHNEWIFLILFLDDKRIFFLRAIGWAIFEFCKILKLNCLTYYRDFIWNRENKRPTEYVFLSKQKKSFSNIFGGWFKKRILYDITLLARYTSIFISLKCIKRVYGRNADDTGGAKTIVIVNICFPFERSAQLVLVTFLERSRRYCGEI